MKFLTLILKPFVLVYKVIAWFGNLLIVGEYLFPRKGMYWLSGRYHRIRQAEKRKGKDSFAFVIGLAGIFVLFLFFGKYV